MRKLVRTVIINDDEDEDDDEMSIHHRHHHVSRALGVPLVPRGPGGCRCSPSQGGRQLRITQDQAYRRRQWGGCCGNNCMREANGPLVSGGDCC